MGRLATITIQSSIFLVLFIQKIDRISNLIVFLVFFFSNIQIHSFEYLNLTRFWNLYANTRQCTHTHRSLIVLTFKSASDDYVFSLFSEHASKRYAFAILKIFDFFYRSRARSLDVRYAIFTCANYVKLIVFRVSDPRLRCVILFSRLCGSSSRWSVNLHSRSSFRSRVDFFCNSVFNLDRISIRNVRIFFRFGVYLVLYVRMTLIFFFSNVYLCINFFALDIMPVLIFERSWMMQRPFECA